MSDVQEKELSFLFPEKQYEIAGREFTLRPFSFHETFAVAEKLKTILPLLRLGMTADAIAEVIISSGKGVEEVMAMALKLDIEDVQRFDIKNAMKAIQAIVEINHDFFVQEVQGILVDLNGLIEE
jgi:hypothetical protein